MIAEDGLVGAVLWQEPRVSIALLKNFDGCFLIQHGRNDIAVLGGLLLTHDDPIAITDGGVNHGISDDFQHEEVPIADQLTRQGHYILHVLFRRDGDTGRDAPNQGDLDRVRIFAGNLAYPRCCLGRNSLQDLQRPRRVGMALDVSSALELTELVGNTGGGREPRAFADFSHAWRNAPRVQRQLDEGLNLLLLFAQHSPTVARFEQFFYTSVRKYSRRVSGGPLTGVCSVLDKSCIRTYIRNRDSDLALPAEGWVRTLNQGETMTTTVLRITRRGRIVLGLAIALPVMALSVFLASPGALAESDTASNDFEYMTVLSGDTLWSIATMISPDEDPRDVVANIISLNQLESAALLPGQEIALPR